MKTSASTDSICKGRRRVSSQHADAADRYRADLEDVFRDLSAVGARIVDLGAINITRENKADIIPVLLRGISVSRYYPSASALIDGAAVPVAAVEVMPFFLNLFRHLPEGYKLAPGADGDPQTLMLDALGDGIGRLAAPAWAGDLIDLVQCSEFGRSRFGIILRLPKTKDPSVSQVLMDLLEDPSVTQFALHVLGTLRLPQALDSAEWLRTSSPDPNVRLEARRAVTRIRGT